MEPGQLVRRAKLGLKRTGARAVGLLAWRPGKLSARQAAKALGVGSVLVISYYFLGALMLQTIDANLNFKPERLTTPGQSEAVSVAVALIDRETDKNGWVGNDPFFKPTVILDNMPNYQKGMMAALARFGFELTDQLGRTRGSSQADEDLQTAAGLLQYPGDVWYWEPTNNIIPQPSSEQQYRKAMKALASYNQRLAQGNAVFERRSDNLQATLARFAADIGSSSAVIDQHLSAEAGFPLHRQADDVFYTVKGQFYGYYMILRALENDFADVISERDLQSSYREMLDSFEAVSKMRPGVIINGASDSQIFPSHLAAQGFYVLRARTQLREIIDILLK